ncbi:MAG: hypothetical protein AB7S41_14205 [Parvibaculaceae bacterium]
MRRLMIVAGFLSLASPALADDLASPSGEAWWKRLAECGGITLALRDEAQTAKKPASEVRGLTILMNDFLDTAWHQLAKDRKLEDSSAKRSVYQAAGARWQTVKNTKEDAATLETTCKSDLTAFKKLVP